MAKVISFDGARSKSRRGRKVRPESRETVQLWQVSQEIDAVVKEAILTRGLPPAEVAAVLAHRLGTLVAVSGNAPALTAFCETILRRLAGGSEPLPRPDGAAPKDA